MRTSSVQRSLADTRNRATGAYMIDDATHNTVAAGMIV
jgi:sulfate adenylyltransferase subunit 1 (EFTu-like GTPase family)